MTPEQLQSPAPKRPYEVFGFTEQEHLFNRVSNERFEEIIDDDRTVIHTLQPSSNDYGEFLFVTTSRPGIKERIAMTFFGLGYHEHRERWISDEWFWYQTEPSSSRLGQQVGKKETREQIQQRLESIRPYLDQDTQTRHGEVFEFLADLTDEDGALSEMEDLETLDSWLGEVDAQIPYEEPPYFFREDQPPIDPPPTGENLLDRASREKLPPLYSGEEKGLDALAQVKFFTPDAQWTWYASEFDGEDIFFGLVDGLDVELGYFSLKEMKETKGPMGLSIERDLYFTPKTLRELNEIHKKEHDNY